MNTRVEKDIQGNRVSAQPVYRGGSLPAYWVGTINNRSLPTMFASASEVFRFADRKLNDAEASNTSGRFQRP